MTEEEMHESYSNLTGVNLEQQKLLWNERGKGYYGEFLVFCELYQHITGNCKILMNLQIPTHNGKTTEIDLLLIHETGLYVFEVKHFKGTIYGKTSDKTWTQYFRTTPNQSFNNPIGQNEYHINILKEMYRSLPICSFIVFTNPDCDIRVSNTDGNVNICELFDLFRVFSRITHNQTPILNLSQIDKIFCQLKRYSPFTQKVVRVDFQETPFYEYIEALKHEFQNKLTKKSKKVRRAKTLSIVFCVFCLVVSSFIVLIFKAKYNVEISSIQHQLNEFAQKFEYVNEFDAGEVVVSKDLVSVSDVVLKNSVELENTVCFSCLLTWNGEDYCVSIGENAKIIVMLKNGQIQEYSLWNNQFRTHYAYLLGWSDYYKTYSIKLREFRKVSASEIDYIKLTNLEVNHKNKNSQKAILTNFEVELYHSS